VAGSFDDEARQAGDAWAPLQAGFFGGSLDRFWKVKSSYDQFVQRQTDSWM
jgi:hypothetical protein